MKRIQSYYLKEFVSHNWHIYIMKNKKIYLYNDIPEGMLYDEISGFSPIVINGDLNLVK